MSMSVYTRIRKSVSETLGEFRGKTLIIGVSGGVDSMLLSQILHDCNFTFIIAHVNFKARGEASDLDAQLVKNWASERMIPFFLKIADKREKAGNFQDWARKQRYRFFTELMQGQNAVVLVMAHHADDQTETILLKMLRGANPVNWSAMQIKEDKTCRPLLPFSKSELYLAAEYCGVPWREDSSNFEEGYARNLIRNQLGLDLDQKIPGWRTNLNEIPVLLKGVEEIIRSALASKSEKNKINAKWLLGFGKSAQITILNSAIDSVFGEEIMRSKSQFSRVDELEHLQTGKSIEIAPEIQVLRDREYFVLFKNRSKNSIDAQMDEIFSVESLPVENRLVSLHLDEFSKPEKGKLQIKIAVLGGTFRIRNWQNGDGIALLGLGGHQKVSDLITNRKIPASKKNDVLVVMSFDGIISAVIFPCPDLHGQIGAISEQAKCNPGDACLKIELSKNK